MSTELCHTSQTLETSFILQTVWAIGIWPQCVWDALTWGFPVFMLPRETNTVELRELTRLLWFSYISARLGGAMCLRCQSTPGHVVCLSPKSLPFSFALPLSKDLLTFFIPPRATLPNFQAQL